MLGICWYRFTLGAVLTEDALACFLLDKALERMVFRAFMVLEFSEDKFLSFNQQQFALVQSGCNLCVVTLAKGYGGCESPCFPRVGSFFPPTQPNAQNYGIRTGPIGRRLLFGATRHPRELTFPCPDKQTRKEWDCWFGNRVPGFRSTSRILVYLLLEIHRARIS